MRLSVLFILGLCFMGSLSAVEAKRVCVRFERAELSMALMSLQGQLKQEIKVDPAIDQSQRITLTCHVKDWKMALDVVAVLIEADLQKREKGFLLKPKTIQTELVKPKSKEPVKE